MTYSALDVAPEDLAPRVREFFATGGRGLNVTVPHKQAVIALTDSLSARARTAGAANTILCDAAGNLLADNTDGAGLVRDLTHNLHIGVRARRVLLLGAGGAARGVLAPLLRARAARTGHRQPRRRASARAGERIRSDGTGARQPVLMNSMARASI